MAAGTVVVAVAGATVILLALGGLMEISQRAGPFDEALTPASVPYQVKGSYLARGATGSQGPGGVCIPDSPGGVCAAPRFEVDLRLTGLPILGPKTFYVAWATGANDANALSLGALRPEGDSYSVRYSEARDGREFQRILVTFDQDARPPSPTVLRIMELDVAGQGRTAPHNVDRSAVATVATGGGQVRLAEIGAMAKSVVAIGELNDVRQVPGWTYQGWFVSIGAEPRYIAVDPFQWSETDSGHAILDVRVENLRVEDQAVFLVTLEASGAPVREAPGGFPAFAATLQE